MNKRGFTLIELLAVIVILAIIAVIAVPIVLNIIDESKNNATLRSAEMYVKAAELSIAQSTLKDKNITDGEYKLKDGDICLNTDCTDKLDVEVNGDVPKEGTITITNGNISDLSIVLNGKTIVKNEKGKLVYQTNENNVAKVCELSDENADGQYSVGDIITCAFTESTEQFYVIENENEDTTPEKIDMFSKYRLNVGRNAYSDGTLGIQNETAEEKDYANIEFSNDAYWLDENSNLLPQYGNNYPAYVYDSNSNLYQYVSAYEEYLKENGVVSASATLINEEQFNIASNFISNSFWSGIVSEGGTIYSSNSGNTDWNKDDAVVRPVVTIAKSEVNLIYEEINTEPDNPQYKPQYNSQYKPQYYFFNLDYWVNIGHDLPSDAKRSISEIDIDDHLVYLGFDVDANNKVTTAYACFIKNGIQYCLKGNDPSAIENNKKVIEEAFKEEIDTDICDFDSNEGHEVFSCGDDSIISAHADYSGYVRTHDYSVRCNNSGHQFGCEGH